MKSLVHVLAWKCWGLRVNQSVFFHKIFDGFRFDISVVEIGLIAQKHNTDIGLSIFLELVEPFANIIETIAFGNIKDNNSTLGSSIVGIGYGSESFLTSSIPDLTLDSFVADFESFNSKLDSNCRFWIHAETIIYKSRK